MFDKRSNIILLVGFAILLGIAAYCFKVAADSFTATLDGFEQRVDSAR